MSDEKEIFQLAEYLKKFTEKTGAKLLKTLDPIAHLVDRDLRIENLGNNAVVNALIYVLDVYIAKMSSYHRDKEEEDLYDRIHLEHGMFLRDLIAKYSATKKSYMVDIREEEKK
jgi:hypothetical protein